MPELSVRKIYEDIDVLSKSGCIRVVPCSSLS